jgi:hypothetical protein
MRKAMTMTIAGALMLALTGDDRRGAFRYGYHACECLAKQRSAADHNRCTSVLWDKNCRRWARMAYLGSSGDMGCRVGVAGASSLVGKWCVGTAA